MDSTILLLSGGQSRRMGEDKSQLCFQGQSLLAWQKDRFIAAGWKVVCGLQDRFDGFKGPLAGIDAAFEQHPEISSWIILPVDMPEVTSAVLNQLETVGKRAQKPVCYTDCPLPLYIPKTEQARQLLEQWLSDDNGKRSVFALMEALDGVWQAPNGFKKRLFNINTPDQWQLFLQGAVPL